MSPEERARSAAQTILDFAPVRRAAGCEPFHVDQMAAIIAEAIQATVAAERERCAKIAESLFMGQGPPVAPIGSHLAVKRACAVDIADAIREVPK